MTEVELELLIEGELAACANSNTADIDCFKAHRIKPEMVSLCLDQEERKWVECYLVTNHNGTNDSPYRVAFDPAHMQFVKETTLENGTPLYLGRYPDLESLLDGYS